MTLNVCSIANKLQAVGYFLKTRRVHTAVITDTHVQKGDPIDMQIKDYTLVSTCKRKQGAPKGGTAIYVHTSLPYLNGEERTAQEQREIEYCSAAALPNHNETDKLAIVGAYSPPEKEHPEYVPMLNQMLRNNKEQGRTTVLMGDFNMNLWGKLEKEYYQEWIESENLRGLSNPRFQHSEQGQ